MKVTKLLERNEKKIYIDRFLGEQEPDENGSVKQVDYVTIKKIPYAIKKKIEFASANTMSGKTSKHIIKEMKKRGIKYSEIDKLTQEQQVDILTDMEIDSKTSEVLTKLTNEIAKCILNYGVDSKKHSFIDEDDNPIELNYDFFDMFGNIKLVDYLIAQIKNFSEGVYVGE